MFHVGAVFVAAVVLAPGEVALEEAGVDGGHFGGAVIFFFADVARRSLDHGYRVVVIGGSIPGS